MNVKITPSDEEPAIHETAMVDGEAVISPGAIVGPYSQIGAGCSVGIGSVLATHVVLGSDVRVGDRVLIASGAYVSNGVELSEGVSVGPNVVFVEGKLDGAATTVGPGASIGANASILSGVAIGMNVTVGAGSVVTREVPPFATVVGTPARIVGYQSSPEFKVTKHLRASEIESDDFPLSIGQATLSLQPRIDDIRGSLTFGEVPVQLPFAPVRYFLVYGVPTREVRGEHAHHKLHELVTCVHGECAVTVDDGYTRAEVVLDRPDVALHLPPKVWRCHYNYSRDAVLLSFCSEPYDGDDYIRSYAAFRHEVTGG